MWHPAQLTIPSPLPRNAVGLHHIVLCLWTRVRRCTEARWVTQQQAAGNGPPPLLSLALTGNLFGFKEGISLDQVLHLVLDLFQQKGLDLADCGVTMVASQSL